MARDVPVVVDLFSGAGGMSLGFLAAGCRSWRASMRTMPRMRPSWTISRGYRRTTHPSSRLRARETCSNSTSAAIPGGSEVDILIGGPPCQGFSRIGRAKLDSLQEKGYRDEGFEGDPRNELYKVFLEAVRRWKPRACVMENVPGCVSLRGQNVAEDMGGDLADSGYRVGYAVLNAAWYGVPHSAERLFFIGISGDLGMPPAMPPAVPPGPVDTLRILHQRRRTARSDRIVGLPTVPHALRARGEPRQGKTARNIGP